MTAAAVKSRQVSWIMYVVGSLLVFGSWVDLVPNTLGWIGWLMALAGWGADAGFSRSSSAALSVAEQLERLEGLRQRQAITEDEFQSEKRRLLADSAADPRASSRPAL